MRTTALLFVILATLGISAKAQGDWDIRGVKANKSTFVFNDGRRTVNGYIYQILEEEYQCCGNDAVYVEVVIDQYGNVSDAIPVTGKTDCYKEAITDIIRRIHWEAGAETIYFEVKPIIPCSGEADENGGDIAMEDDGESEEESDTEDGEADSQDDGEPEDWDDGEEEEDGDEEIADADDEEFDDDSEAEDEEDMEEEDDVADAGDEEDVDDEGTEEEEDGDDIADFLGDDEVAQDDESEESGTDEGSEESGDEGDVDAGEPTETEDVMENVGPMIVSNETEFARNLENRMVKKGLCGNVQAVFALTVNPVDGVVVEHKVIKTSSGEIEGVIPDILRDLQFAPTFGSEKYITYVSLKTDLECKE